MTGTVQPQGCLTDEVERQRAMLDRERLPRALATIVSYGLCALFLPWWFVAACAATNMSLEVLQHRLLQRPDLLARPLPRLIYLLNTFCLELCFVLPSAIMWHHPNPFVKVFAVGMAMGAMLHVATMRAIHLPMGLSAAAAILATTVASNTLYWTRVGDMPGLAVSSVALALSLGYFLSAMMTNHGLHRQAAALRATAEEASAAKGRFLAQMSHEIRTPLNGILGMARAMQREADDPVMRERLGVLLSSAEGLGTMLDDVLDSAAVEAGTLPIRPARTVPADQIDQTVALFRARAAEAGQILALTVAPGLDRAVLIDAQRLRQCLANLLSNAIKFGGPGTLRIAAAPVTLPGGAPGLSVTVCDTGPGIALADREALFDPMARRNRANPKSGSGLGLSISRSLARAMAGDLVLQDDAVGGACFHLTVALMPIADADPPAAPAEAAACPDLRGRRALVVDDIATNRLVAATYLGALGVTAVESASGREAIARMAQGGIDVVLLDMNMPGLDGFQTFAQLRAMPGPVGQVPVIAMTADAMESQRRACLEAGLDGYVAKPVCPDRLAEELHRALRPTLPAGVA